MASTSTPAAAGPVYWTRREVAAVARCNDDTVSRMVKRGDLPAPIVISRSRFLWVASEVLAALDRLRQRGQGAAEGDPHAA